MSLEGQRNIRKFVFFFKNHFDNALETLAEREMQQQVKMHADLHLLCQ